MSFMDVSYTNTDTTPKLRKEKIRKIKKDIISQINELEKEMNDLGNYMDSFIYELVASELKIALFNKRARITIENVKKGQPHNKLTKNGIKKVPYEPTGFEILSKDKK